MSGQDLNLIQTLLKYRVFEILGAAITIIAIGFQVYLYLENMRRSMEDLQEDVRSTMQGVIEKVDHAYESESVRDATWLQQDENDTRDILLKIDELESRLIEFISTGRDDEAWQRGVHEGHHQALNQQLRQDRGIFELWI